MSAFTPTTDAPSRGRAAPPGRAPDVARDRTVRRVALVASVLVLGWSFVELVSLSFRHTTGPELYGVLVAALATGAGVANVALLRSPRARTVVILAVLVVWAIVAAGGIAGTVAHVVGVPAGEGPVDPRPRPFGAPLIFTLLGSIGGAALLVGRRAFRTLLDPGKE